MKVSKDFVPYLNVTAKWDEAPDQDFLAKKGGRGFPFCAFMDSEGEVLWEARPMSEKDFTEAHASATKLNELKVKLAAHSDDKSLAASVALMDALGREQRPAPELAELEAHAKAEGIDADVKTRFDAWLAKNKAAMEMAAKEAPFTEAVQAFRTDGGEKVLAMFKEGKVPPAGGRMELSYYYYVVQAALKAKDAATATKGVEGFEKAAEANPAVKGNPRVKTDIEKMRTQIKELGGNDK